MSAYGTSNVGISRGGEYWHLCLYVAGQSAKSLDARANLTRLCEEHVHGRYQIQVIDLVEHPALARSEDILATPALIRRLPEPVRKFIGDLSNPERMLVELRLRSSQ